jgi:hypothetical protein
MTSRKLLLSFLAVFLTALAVVWWVGALPARVTVINRAARSMREVTIIAGGRRVELGDLRGGEARVASVPSGGEVMLTFRGQSIRRRWRSGRPVPTGQTLVLYIDDNEEIEVRR